MDSRPVPGIGEREIELTMPGGSSASQFGKSLLLSLAGSAMQGGVFALGALQDWDPSLTIWLGSGVGELVGFFLQRPLFVGYSRITKSELVLFAVVAAASAQATALLNVLLPDMQLGSRVPWIRDDVDRERKFNTMAKMSVAALIVFVGFKFWARKFLMYGSWRP